MKNQNLESSENLENPGSHHNLDNIIQLQNYELN